MNGQMLRFTPTPNAIMLPVLILLIVLLNTGCALARPPPRWIEFPDAASLAAFAAGPPARAGDVLVVSSIEHGATLRFRAERRVGDEPIYLVGAEHARAVLARHELSPAAIMRDPASRRLLLDPPSHQDGAMGRGARIAAAELTPARFRSWRFTSGTWAIAGFDFAAATQDRALLEVGDDVGLPSDVRAVIAQNRFSSCDSAFLTCLWTAVGVDGKRQNGGVLIKVSADAVARIENNLFENLRGAMGVNVSNGARGVEIVDNTFRRLRQWADNGGEAIHLGSVSPVLHPSQPPSISRLDALIAGNAFIDATPETELIGVKGSHVRIMDNVILDSPASGISLRDGSDVLVENNLIIRSRGIRVMGDRPVIRGNQLIEPEKGFGIWLENGAARAGYECGRLRQRSPGQLMWAYRAAETADVIQNRVVVRDGQQTRAIVRRMLDKSCFAAACEPIAALPCDQIMDDDTFAAMLRRGRNRVEIER